MIVFLPWAPVSGPFSRVIQDDGNNKGLLTMSGKGHSAALL